MRHDHPQVAGHRQNAAPASAPHQSQCRTCTQLGLKTTLLQEKVAQMEECNRMLTEKAQQMEGERSADGERIQELLGEVESLREQNQQMSK